MSTLTDRIYAAWKRQNGSGGGMGVVTPMKALQWPFKRSESADDALTRLRISSRPEKQKETPASATNTPGAVTNIREGNADGTHCRS